MSNPHAPAPSHGHPDSSIPSTRDLTESRATGDHPPSTSTDPTLASSQSHHAGTGRFSSTAASSSPKLADLKVNLRNALRQYPDFPSPGILFEDIMPIFSNPSHHRDLITALELQITDAFPQGRSSSAGIDVIVGLESRGFLFGPTLALNLGAGFVPVRKQGKLPGETVTEGYEKEYGTDFFQIQRDAIQPGQRVVVVDDIIATGGSAAAAGNLVKQLGGQLLGYVFLMELDFLKGRDKLDAPVHTLLSGQEEALKST